jgi:cell division cycle 14
MADPVGEAFQDATADSSELVEGKLYYVVEGIGLMVSNEVPTNYAALSGLHFFHVDGIIRYFPFCDDFGPFNLASIFRFLEILDAKLVGMPDKTIVLCCRTDRKAITNAGFLMGAYLLLELGYDADSPLMPLSNVSPSPYLDFRDATYGPVTFGLSIRDAWRGLAKAHSLGWFDAGSNDAFDLEEYEHYENPGNGDLHWLVPNKILAFKGPTHDIPAGRTWFDSKDVRMFSPEFYVESFLDMGVACVVRLNEAQYDRQAFVQRGLEHVDLFLNDCTVPPPSIVLRFLEIVERTSGAMHVAQMHPQHTHACMQTRAQHAHAQTSTPMAGAGAHPCAARRRLVLLPRTA